MSIDPFIVCTGSYLPIDETAECDFLYCLAGMGLAGSGRCFLFGDPKDPNCPKFEDEEIYLAIWEYEDLQEWLAQ